MARHFPAPLAAFRARTPSEIAAHLTTLAGSPRVRIDAGRAARHFARMHLSPLASARRCVAHLGASIAQAV